MRAYIMQNWKDLYGELATKLTDNINDLKWVDLWHNQINFLDDEHPFPTPAVFMSFRSGQVVDISDKVQNVQLQVDIFVFYETFLDTFKAAYNQADALGFLDLLDDINKQLHGSSGENYSSMRRVGFNPVDTGNSGNLYLVTYTCELIDHSAQPNWQEVEANEMEIERFIILD